MGVPMAANLARAGFAVQSYDVRGNGTNASVRHAAEGADVLLTMLPDGEAVREVVLEALPALERGALVIDMSSADPAGTLALGTALAAKGIALVDAPVSGALPKAKDGTLAIMVGGSAEDVKRARPVLVDERAERAPVLAQQELALGGDAVGGIEPALAELVDVVLLARLDA